MPLFVRDENIYWTETLSKLQITVNISCSNVKNVYILNSSSYLRVSSLPYIWECALYDEVDCEDIIIRIGDSMVTFDLKKKEEKLWGRLKHIKCEDKQFCRDQYRRALEETEKRQKEKADSKATEKYKSDREAVRKQMHIDEQQRKQIEERKKAERKKMATEIQLWVKESESNSDNTSPSQVVEEEIPAPRRMGNICVSFTERVFPTAARESKEDEELQWLEKQAATRRKIEEDLSDLTPQQRNPVWLKDKGDSFLKNEDYHSAINAYSLALKMCPSYYRLYLDRAFCHLNLRNLHKALEDSSKALELLDSLNPKDCDCRMKCHLCRGRALCQLEMYTEGLIELEAALKLDRKNTSLEDEIQGLRKTIQKGVGTEVT